ncbi:MAG: ATP synthase F0 subunit B [Deltaproteobacteria bacterium]|nr:ATP synthase F0 subunit B [Deltaproteobacteria bacterium]
MSPTLLCIASGGSLVDVDGTFFIQMGIFFVMFIFLHFALFKPVMRMIAARHEATVGTTKKSQVLCEEAAELVADVDRKLAEIREEAAWERNRIIGDARKTERELLAAAQEASRREMANARGQMSESATGVREQLKKELGALADAVASRLMNRAG